MRSLCLDCGYVGPTHGACPQCRRSLVALADVRAAYAESVAEGPSGLRAADPSLPEEVRAAATLPSNDIGRFILLQLLGKGGMGEVHKAWQKDLRRFVAIKFVSAASDEDRQRVAREARVAAQLDHENLVPVHEADTSNRACMIVMKYVDGATLDRAPLGLRERVRALRDAARAIAHAHRHGVLHRDLKPQNIIIESETGRAYVMDFGLARETSVDASLSATGRIVGTPQFMPPEQAVGDPSLVDERSDVYGLGATLYAILTGVPPFLPDEQMRVLQRVCTEEPIPPRRRDPSIPRDLETIALKCLEKNKARRYAGASEVVDELDRWLNGDSIQARPTPWPVRIARRIRRNPVRWGVGAASVLAVLAGLGVWIGSRLLLRAERARTLAAEAEAALRDHGDWRLRLVGRRQRVEELRKKSAPHDPPSRREDLIRAEEEVREAERSAKASLATAEQRAIEALGFDRENAAARRVLARVYYDAYLTAENLRDPSATRGLAERVIAFGGEEYRALLEAPATLDLTTDPPGAAGWLFHYEPRGSRLVPVPWRGTIEVAPVDPLPQDAFEEDKRRVREGTAYPLPLSSGNRVTFPIRLPAGSYLVLFHGGARYPVLLRRGETHQAAVRLIDGLPEGFIYVPEGPTIAANDPEMQEITAQPRETTTPQVSSFIIAKFSVTCGEYLQFLNDRSFQTLEEAMKRRTQCGKEWPLREGHIEPGDWKPGEPIAMMPTEGLEAFARWYTKRHGRGRWTFRLPSEDEWEKAARGVDGRYFPWGDRFDPGFCVMAGSRATPFSIRYHSYEPVGLFPADESPYGVRDMAGGIRTITSTPTNNGTSRIFKGGSWDLPAQWCRASTRFGNDPAIGLRCDGLRLAASVDR